MSDWLAEVGSRLSAFDYFVILGNALLALFSPHALARFTRLGDADRAGRISILRVFSIILLILYLLSVALDLDFGSCAATTSGCDPLRRISLSGLTLIAAYAAYTIAHFWIVRRFGRERVIEGQLVFTMTYQAELLLVVSVVLTLVAVLVAWLNIWGVESWLRGTSILGALLLILFFTKEVWLGDAINGLILLHSSEFEPGSVVRIEALDLLAVVLRTSLIETTFRDLVQRHAVVLPNALLRSNKIEILSQTGSSGLRVPLDFKIGYDHDASAVEAMLEEAWRRACALENGINGDVSPRILVAENGDHAVTWRVIYVVANVYRLIPARYAMQRGAFEASREAGIGLSTPITFDGTFRGQLDDTA